MGKVARFRMIIDLDSGTSIEVTMPAQPMVHMMSEQGWFEPPHGWTQEPPDRFERDQRSRTVQPPPFVRLSFIIRSGGVPYTVFHHPVSAPPTPMSTVDFYRGEVLRLALAVHAATVADSPVRHVRDLENELSSATRILDAAQKGRV